MVAKSITKKDIIKLLIIITLIILVLAFSGIAKKKEFKRGSCKLTGECKDDCQECCWENKYDETDDDEDDEEEDIECNYDTDCSGTQVCNSLHKCITREEE